MRRFLQAYLTIFAVTVLLANLVLIWLYGKQFILEAASRCEGCLSPDQAELATAVLWVNLFLAGIFLTFWLIARAIAKAHPPEPF